MKKDLNLLISSSTVRRRLIKNNLNARRSSKTQFLNAKQLKKRLQFSKENDNCPTYQ